MTNLKKICFVLTSIILLNIKLISCLDASLSAIDIDTSKVKFLPTPTPLTITQSIRQTSTITNTGKTLTSVTFQPQLATIFGGLLDDVYFFCQDEFYWSLALKPKAGIKIDGMGSPVQVVLTFTKGKCGGGGKTVQLVVFIYVDEFIPAQDFTGFNLITNRVLQAGTTTIGSEYAICAWFFTTFTNPRYYMYTATNGATVVVIPDSPENDAKKMTYQQFNETFGRLKNKNNKSYSHIAPKTHSRSTITSSEGIKIISTL